MIKRRFSKKRESELDQLVNDIAEDMNMRRWKRADFIDCINLLQDRLVEQGSQFVVQIDGVKSSLASWIFSANNQWGKIQKPKKK